MSETHPQNSTSRMDNDPPQQEVGVEEPREASVEDQEINLLRQQLEAARKRVDELARAYQALNADREEFKQRLTRERERLLDVERGTVAQALLDAIDELDLCLQASAEDKSALAAGVKLIRGKLLGQVASLGIERLSVVGKTFDPSWGEAADAEITDDVSQDQVVVSEVRAGYRLKDRVIRPARVRVAKYVKPADA